MFGALARARVAANPRLSGVLERAHVPLRPEVFLASAYFIAAVTAAVVALPVILLAAAALGGVVAFELRYLILIAPAPFVAGAIAYLVALALPDLRVLNRRRDIDAKLPYALNYIATMAAAGATPEALFAGLAQQQLYGEVAVECAWITRDLRLLGSDVVGALQRGIDRSPSMKFQDFLQGAVTALSSGGDLKTYFSQKAEQFLYENRQEQRKFLDGLGVLAEAFVTVVVAAPLFLIVILSVLTSFGGSAEDTLILGYSLVFLVIPMAQAAFGWTIKVMTPEA